MFVKRGGTFEGRIIQQRKEKYLDRGARGLFSGKEEVLVDRVF